MGKWQEIFCWRCVHVMEKKFIWCFISIDLHQRCWETSSESKMFTGICHHWSRSVSEEMWHRSPKTCSTIINSVCPFITEIWLCVCHLHSKHWTNLHQKIIRLNENICIICPLNPWERCMCMRAMYFMSYLSVCQYLSHCVFNLQSLWEISHVCLSF